jgi:septum formation protein
MRLVLASGSPRRRELLASLGLDFEVRPVDLDETPRAGEQPEAYVARLAREKAAAALQLGGPGPDELVIAADTVVVLDGELLGKPADPAEARAMLRRLAGREHTVHTGVELAESTGAGVRRAAAIATSRVRIAPLDDATIAWYVATGEPLDKAGAYAIQDLGALFVETVDGNYTNVVGLPVPTVYRLFRELGEDLLAFRHAR